VCLSIKLPSSARHPLLDAAPDFKLCMLYTLTSSTTVARCDLSSSRILEIEISWVAWKYSGDLHFTTLLRRGAEGLEPSRDVSSLLVAETGQVDFPDWAIYMLCPSLY